MRGAKDFILASILLALIQLALLLDWLVWQAERLRALVLYPVDLAYFYWYYRYIRPSEARREIDNFFEQLRQEETVNEDN